jgi:excisionase family DNA binding protein
MDEAVSTVIGLDLARSKWDVAGATEGQMSTDPQSEWLTANEAAQYLKVKPRSLLLWARQGKINGYTLSGTRRRIWRFRREDLDSALLHSDVVRSDPLTVLDLERRNS